jgi:predicted dehydrogenase
MSNPDLSRRNFILNAGAGLVAAVAPTLAAGVPLAPPDQQPPNLPVPPGHSGKVGFAVVGLGELALEQVLPAFGQSKHARPVALVSGHPGKAKKVAEFYEIDSKNIYSYENYDSLKDNPALQAIYVILPNHMHAEYTIRGLKAGKHVLCEKPMAPTSDECRRMIAASKETGKKLMVAYRLRYEPFNTKAIEIVRSGQLGKPRVIEAQNMQVTNAPNIRLSKKTAGGPLSDVGIYCLQACRYMTGEEPVEVSAFQQQPSDDPRFAEVPESVMWQMTFPSGVLAMCMAGFGSQVSSRYRIDCSEGWLQLDPAFKYTGLQMETSKDKEIARHQIEPANQFALEMDHFCECVLQDKQPLTPGEEGLRDILILEKINEAIRTGGRVSIGELV